MTMRVTDQSSLDQILAQIQTAQLRLQQSQDRATTGLRVERPSDDPAAWGQIQGHSQQLGLLDSYSSNISATRSVLQGADTAMQSMQGVLTRFRQVTQEGISLVRDPASVAAEGQNLQQELLDMVNTQVGGVYVFGGYAAGPPQVGGNFVGDNQKRAVQVSPLGATVYGVSAQDAFGVTPGQPLFAGIAATVNAMQTGNVAGMQAGLDEVDQAMRQISVAQASLGAQENSLDLADQANQAATLNLSQAITAQRDEDPAKAYSQLAADQYTMTATYTVIGSVSKMSLLKYL